MTAPLDRQAWDRRYADPGLIWTDEPNRFLVKETAGLTPTRALDLACGEGRNAVWLADQGWEVTGVDFSQVALEKARVLAAARDVLVRWEAADLLTYSPEPRGYGLVVLLYLQVPPDERRIALRAAAEAVAPGGRLLVVAHDSSNLERGYGGPRDPAVLYTAGDVAADLAGSGLEVARAERVSRPVSTPDGERIALDALLHARRPAGSA